MIFKKGKKTDRKKSLGGGSLKDDSSSELEDFVEAESIEKNTLKSLSDEELAKAIRTVLTKSKLN